MPRRAAPQPLLRRLTRKTVVTILFGTFAIVGIIWVGFATAAIVRHRDRYTIPLSALDYHPPAWVDANTFLAEVRYLGDLPERFNAFDEGATRNIHAAFEKHPWVEHVGGGYFTVSRRYHLEVHFREPVLLVRTTEEVPTAWMVDANGVLLPSIHVIENLAELKVRVPPPKVTAGKLWDDPTVKRAASLAKLYRAKTVDRSDTGWRITDADGRVLVIGS